MRKLLIIVGAVFFVLFALLGYGKYTYSHTGVLVETKNIVIPKGNTNTVLIELQKEKALPSTYWSGLVFRIAVVVTHKFGALHAAEFAFPKGASMQQIISILRYSKPVQHELTIPEGLTAYQIAGLINQAPFLVDRVEVPVEGTVLPQTYFYEWGYSREKLLQKMQEAMQKTVTNIWEHRVVTPEVTSIQDLVTLASMVEKETAVKRERSMVARVFINRLRLKMRLQSDPTVIYALTDGKGYLDRKLTRQDWEVANPYNTYWADALPPTPICSPGKAALEAVAHPAEGNMLYFVANGTAGHSFATSLSQHNRNVLLRKTNK